MPPLKTCRLQFIQQVLSHEKKVLLQKDVPTRMVPLWPQLGVKYIYPQAIEALPEIAEYLPDLIGKNEKRFPDRDYFYKVFNALKPDIVDSIIQQVAQRRKTKSQLLSEQQWSLAVKDDWMEQLLLHDFQSSK